MNQISAASTDSPTKQNRIMAYIGGSQAHGAENLEVTDDTDWYGLYIPPPTKVLGLDRARAFRFFTGGQRQARAIGRRRLPLHAYEMGKPRRKGESFGAAFFVALLNSRPSRGITLRTAWSCSLRGACETLSGIRRRSAETIARSEGREDVTATAALEEKHGYDTKYASAHRSLGNGEQEAKELMESGRISLPRIDRTAKS